MTQKDKELLLKDLSGRLPYGVKVRTNRGPEIIEGLAPFCHNQVKIALNLDWSLSISSYIPYLRPMLSITEEEKDEFYNNGSGDVDFLVNGKGLYFRCNSASFEDINYAINWLNVHHFDYRGLIEKGLALEAPEGMYNIKEQ